MRKLIKQNILILLSLIAATYPQAAQGIDREAKKLTMQGTRDYLFLLRGDKCRICPYADAFRSGSDDNAFWLNSPNDTGTILAMHLHIIRCARDSPEGSVVALDFEEMRDTIKSADELQGYDCHALINQSIHRTLTHTPQTSTQDFMLWMKGDTDVWK